MIGLTREVVDKFFTGTPSHLEGSGLDGIAQIVLRWHRRTFSPSPDDVFCRQETRQRAGGEARLASPGFYKFKRDGEQHAYSPQVVRALHEAVKLPGALNGRWPE